MILKVLPISKSEAEDIFRSELTDETWAAVEKCFSDFGVRLNSVEALPADNVNRNDPRSYPIGRARALKDIAKAIRLIQGVANDRALCRSASQIYAMKRDGYPASGAISESLHTATMALTEAKLRFQYAAEPIFAHDGSKALAKREMARAIVDVLREAGLDTRLTGWDEAALPEAMAETDMTPTEQLLSALGVHSAERPSAFVRWLRDALVFDI